MHEDIDSVINFQYAKEEKHTRMLKYFKDKSKLLHDENKSLLAIKEYLEKSNQELEQQKTALTNEVVVLRKSVNNFHSRSEIDNVCKNCKKIYKEEENFNWSCKTHLSKHNGSMYWCCGKSEPIAEGCIISKHISADDEEGHGSQKHEKSKFCSVIPYIELPRIRTCTKRLSKRSKHKDKFRPTTRT